MIDWGQVVSDADKEIIAQKQKRQIEKYKKQKMIDEISVVVDGLVFDGNEKSQSRMTLVANAISDDDCVLWVLHNNETASVTGRQLREAVRLSSLQMSNIWTGD